MYIARNGAIRTGDALEAGEVEITEVQYQEALAGILEGKVVSVDGGFSVAFPEEPEEPEPEPEEDRPLTPQIITVAALQVNVVDGVIGGIETAVGMSLAFAIDVGVYWVFFTDPQPDMSYIWNVGSSSGTVNVASRDLTMMELRAYEGGAPADPSEISIQVFRVM